MTEAAIQARREYQKAWRAANRDRVKASNVRYWERKAAEKRQKEEKNGRRAKVPEIAENVHIKKENLNSRRTEV